MLRVNSYERPPIGETDTVATLPARRGQMSRSKLQAQSVNMNVYESVVAVVVTISASDRMQCG